MDKKAYEKLPDVVGVLEEFYGRLDLSPEDEQALLGHVRNIKGQLYQPAADDSFVSEQLSAIRDILSTRAGNELADAAVAEIDGMLGSADGAAAKGERVGGSAGSGGIGAKAGVPPVLGVVAGIAVAVSGAWLVSDGLLGGLVADRKEMGIGIAALAAGVFVLMIGLQWLVRSAWWRTAVGVVVLLAVVAFALVTASRAADRDETIDIGAQGESVIISGTDQRAAVASEGMRAARWYESGVEVTLKRDSREETITVPRKYVVTPDRQ